jgi:transposase
MEQEKVSLLPMESSGGGAMIRPERWYEIHSRFKLKESKKLIARSLGISVQTVRRILRQQEPKGYERPKASESILEPYKDYIRQRLPSVGYCAQAIYEELLEKQYRGGYDTVKLFVRPLREEATREATVRFETPPGKQSQVDWGECWTLLGEKRMKVHLFVMTLGYSRRMFSRATLDERLPTLLRCHEEAFDYFGGFTHEIVYDNPKTVILSRDFAGRQIKWNPIFWDFAGYYGFKTWAHRPYRAQTKGKVESGIKYVKRFLRGKSFESLEHLNQSLMNWITTFADQRIHGTTHRRPIEMFDQEKDLLSSHQGKGSYRVQERVVRHVAKDCLVTFETNRYSVPHRFVGKPVEVQAWNDRVLIFYQDQLIVSHLRLEGKYQNQILKDHYVGIFYREDLPSVSLLHFNYGPLVEVRDLSVYEDLLRGGVL